MNLQRARDQYVRYVAIERGLSSNTVAAYTRDIDAYFAWLGERGITEAERISLQDVSAFVQWLATRPDSPLTSSSQSRTLSSIKGFHKFLLEENIVDTDVTVDVNPPKLPQRLPKAISVDQMSALLAATDGDDEVRVRDKALLELLYATGARISEAVSLNVDDVTAAEGMIRLRGKGGSSASCPWAPMLRLH